jgi:hypothetical protein
MNFDYLTIIPGLEQAFFKAFQLGSTISPTTLRQRTLPPARRLFPNLSARSLFVKWQSLYVGFDIPRRSAWTDFWGTLPFGTHWGANEFPGSGFSAFVYINAPRYQSGLDLLLDPPNFSELIYNGNFSLYGDGWQVEDPSINFTGYNAEFNPISGGYFKTGLTHRFYMQPNASYHMEFDLIDTDGYMLVYIEQVGGGIQPLYKDFTNAPLTHAVYNFDTPNWGYSLECELKMSCSANTYASIGGITLRRTA